MEAEKIRERQGETTTKTCRQTGRQAGGEREGRGKRERRSLQLSLV